MEFEAQQAKLQEAQKQQEQSQVVEVAAAADASLAIPASANETPVSTDSGNLETTVAN